MVYKLFEGDLAQLQAEAFSTFGKHSSKEIAAEILCDSSKGKTLVDIGCGAGFTTRTFLDAGYHVVAIEPSRALLDIARQNAASAEFLCASIYDATLPPCYIAVALSESLSYHLPGTNAPAKLRDFFSKAVSALAPKGQLIFDIVITGSPSLSAKVWQESSKWTLMVETTELPTKDRLTRRIVSFHRVGDLYRRDVETHHVCLFDAGSVISWLEKAGFDVETRRSYGAQALLPRRLAFFATRR